MDPNATWNEMCEIAEEMANGGDAIEPGTVERLAELTLALRDWVEGGGFPPKAFQK